MIKSLPLEELTQINFKDGFDINLKLEKIERANYIRLMYKIWNDEVQGVSIRVNNYDYRVRLTKTKCNISGWRYWFRCPLIIEEKKCNRRISVLYLPPDERHFGCKHCHDLIYQSQCLSGKDKRFGVIIPFDVIKEKEESFRTKSYRGLPTRRYKAFAQKAGRNILRFQRRANDLMG